jgi:hypothetical protein
MKFEDRSTWALKTWGKKQNTIRNTLGIKSKVDVFNAIFILI